MKPKLLPTTVIGSYSLPRWLEVVRKYHENGNLTNSELEEAHDAAVRTAVKDQELAGIDIISDGELRRETMVYFFAKRIKGFQLYGPLKPIGNLDSSIQMPDPIVNNKIERGDLELAKHYKFLRSVTNKSIKVCVTGPHMLAKRAHNQYYKNDRELVFDLAQVLNAELRDLVNAGADFIQIDEPVWVGYPDEVRTWAVEAFNLTVEGIKAKIALHVCYGNYMRQRLFTGTYADLFPAILEVNAAQIVLEFTKFGYETLELFKKYPTDKELGAGVVDVKDLEVETPQQVADRIRQVLNYFPAEKVYLNPDCGLKFVPRDIAFAKLQVLSAGARIVRREL